MHNLKKMNKYKKYTTPISNKNWEKASNTMEDSYITVFDYNSWQIYQYKKLNHLQFHPLNYKVNLEYLFNPV